MSTLKRKPLGDLTNIASPSSSSVSSVRKPPREGRPKLGARPPSGPTHGIGPRCPISADPADVTRVKSEVLRAKSLVQKEKAEFPNQKSEVPKAEVPKQNYKVPNQKSEVRTEKCAGSKKNLEVLELKIVDRREKNIVNRDKLEYLKENCIATELKSGTPKEKSVLSKEKCEDPGICMQKDIQRREDKGKAVVVVEHMSCPPLKRLRESTMAFRDQVEMAKSNIAFSKGNSAPVSKPKKKRRYVTSDVELPRDFVEKQKAYFAEIDAFELPEEFASENE